MGLRDRTGKMGRTVRYCDRVMKIFLLTGSQGPRAQQEQPGRMGRTVVMVRLEFSSSGQTGCSLTWCRRCWRAGSSRTTGKAW